MWNRGTLPGHASVRETGRREERLKLTVSARMYGTDTKGKAFDLSVLTADVSAGGALLVNVAVALRVGEVFGIKYGADRARYRVQWLTNAGGDSHPQVGVQCLDAGKNIFGAELRPAAAHNESRAMVKRRPMALEQKVQADKRSSFRHHCDIGVQLRLPETKVAQWARCTDLSEGGCYVATRSPLPAGTKFNLTIFVQPQTIEVPCIVRTTFPAIGMGVQFLFSNTELPGRIHNLIASMFTEPSAAPANQSAARPPEVHSDEFNELSHLVTGLQEWAASSKLKEEQRMELEKIARSVRHQLIAARKRIEDGDI